MFLVRKMSASVLSDLQLFIAKSLADSVQNETLTPVPPFPLPAIPSVNICTTFYIKT